jgi:hypothetical protein
MIVDLHNIRVRGDNLSLWCSVCKRSFFKINSQLIPDIIEAAAAHCETHHGGKS